MMDFIKASTREETKDYFINLCKKRILYVDKINIADILRDLEKFENIIMESLKKGEKSFLIPKSVKEINAYKDPFKEQGVRSIVAWNYIYHGNTIELPNKVDIIKVKLSNLKDLEKLESIDERIYNIIKNDIFGSKEPKIAKKGVEVIAIPRNVTTIPEWIIPFIDYDTIVNDNLSRFFSIVESLGLEIIKNTENKYFSNIIKI
jgi:hypothetical protein